MNAHTPFPGLGVCVSPRPQPPFPRGGRRLGLGLSGAKRTWDDRLILGIFVSSLVQNSAAAMEGTLREGDEILEVNGHSLIGVSREGAIDFLKEVCRACAKLVCLKIAAICILRSHPSPSHVLGVPMRPAFHGVRLPRSSSATT